LAYQLQRECQFKFNDFSSFREEAHNETVTGG
jgi:hypothetical protein